MTDLLALEISGALADTVGRGNGLSPEDLESAGPRAERAQRDLLEAREAGKAGFLDLPHRSDLLEASLEQAERLRGRCETLVVCGMGGSALGARALVRALAHPLQDSLPAAARDGRPRVLVLDTVDPAALLPVVEALDPATTTWNFVSKSGTTVETLAAYGVVRPRLRRALGQHWAERVVITTDPSEGPLREEAERERIAALAIPPEVGGRFSVLSPAGLFPAAAAGVDARGLLAGTATAAASLSSADPARNEALRLALVLVLLAERRGRSGHVLLPYRHSLFETALWWRQLWAESLGKDGKGFGATAAVGSADQHSLLQLWMDGPPDKALVLVEVDDPGTDAVIEVPGPPGAPWLAGRTLGDAHRALAAATRVALASRGRPAVAIRLPTLRAETLGALLQLLATATALAGFLTGVNPFGQPGVEEVKRNAAALLGREEDRERRPGVEEALARLRARR